MIIKSKMWNVGKIVIDHHVKIEFDVEILVINSKPGAYVMPARDMMFIFCCAGIIV